MEVDEEDEEEGPVEVETTETTETTETSETTDSIDEVVESCLEGQDATRWGGAVRDVTIAYGIAANIVEAFDEEAGLNIDAVANRVLDRVRPESDDMSKLLTRIVKIASAIQKT